MQCTVLFFAQARELAGYDRMIIDVPREATAGDALEAIMRLHPALQPLRDRIAIAVDERYARLEASLNDGCTIALIPPVSGG